MSLVQIEQSELDTLRKERDDARSEAAEEKAQRQTAETKVTELEGEKTTLTARAEEAETKVTSLEEQANRASLKDTRMKALGKGFVAKLDDMPTTKARLEEKAGTESDEGWDTELKVVEEAAKVKRDADKAEPEKAEEEKDKEEKDKDLLASNEETFSLEELASTSTPAGAPTQTGGVTDVERSSVVGSLAGMFSGSNS